MNRTLGEHLDANGIRWGLDSLLAAGSFAGADIFSRICGSRFVSNLAC